MDRSKNIVIWVSAFAGVLLLYAAYKGKSPLTLISTSLTPATPGTPATPTALATTGVTTADEISGYATVKDGYAYDQNGVMIGPVPAPYAGSPGTYKPGTAN